MHTEFTFNGQREGEKVYEVIKNHPFVLFFPGLKAVFSLLIGAGVFIFWGSNQLSGLILTLSVLVAFAFFFKAYYVYNQSVFLLTSLRVINVDQEGFWKRKITEAELNKIQDVSSSTDGFLKMMLKFGNLIIRTAGANLGSEIVVKNIASPYDIQQKIVKIMSK